jgi:hypothetical protein
MTTTTKGDAFEQRVYDALNYELQNEQLCASPKMAKIFRKKPYHSRDRNAEIVTDVSIEVFFAKSTRPTLIWIFECKDYNARIPVDDLEEFHSKLQQIGEDNTKGTFVTSGALQRGALNFARSKGIGVIRLLPNDQIEHVMEFKVLTAQPRGRNWSEFDSALVNPLHHSREQFFAAQDGQYFADWYALLKHELSSTTQ